MNEEEEYAEETEEVQPEADDNPNESEEISEDEDINQEEEKQPYTPDEIENLLEDDFDKIDTSRLTPEGKLLMKSMQRGLTPKLQEAAEIRKKLEEMEQRIQQDQTNRQESKPETIHDAYEKDPDGVRKALNQKIKQLEEEGASLSQIEEIRDLKDELRQRQFEKIQSTVSESTKQTEATKKLLQAIPDLTPQKEQALLDFAINELGYTKDDLADEVNYVMRGDRAISAAVRINKLYEKMKAPQSVEKKTTKTKPTDVEGAGKGIKKPAPNTQRLLEEAQRTGDWTAYYEATGNL